MQTARELYDATLNAMMDYEATHKDKWNLDAVARYRRLTEAFQKARRRLYLDDPDERAKYSLFIRCGDTLRRIEQSEVYEECELAALERVYGLMAS